MPPCPRRLRNSPAFAAGADLPRHSVGYVRRVDSAAAASPNARRGNDHNSLGGNHETNIPVEDVATLPNIGAPPPRTSGNPDGSNDVTTFGSNGFPAPNAMVFPSSR